MVYSDRCDILDPTVSIEATEYNGFFPEDKTSAVGMFSPTFPHQKVANAPGRWFLADKNIQKVRFCVKEFCYLIYSKMKYGVGICNSSESVKINYVVKWIISLEKRETNVVNLRDSYITPEQAK